MTAKNLYTKQFSQRQICKLVNFSESTVKSWGRKGFRLVGSDGQGEIQTKRGQGGNLSGYNAMELMLTIHLFRQGIDPIIAHTAAVKFSHLGAGSSYGWKGEEQEYDRDPGQLFQQNQTGTLIVIAMGQDALSQSTVAPYQPDGTDASYAMLSSKLGITSQDSAGIAVFDIDGHVMAWREMLGLPRCPNDEIHEQLAVKTE